MEAKEKIELILKHYKLNAKALSELLGYGRPQIIYDIQKGKTKRISNDVAVKIISVFPDIRKSWLLADEGDMLTDSPSTNRHNEAAQIDNEVRTPTLDTAINEISKQRKLVEHSQQQIDRLITIIEKLSGSQTG